MCFNVRALTEIPNIESKIYKYFWNQIKLAFNQIQQSQQFNLIQKQCLASWNSFSKCSKAPTFWFFPFSYVLSWAIHNGISERCRVSCNQTKFKSVWFTCFYVRCFFFSFFIASSHDTILGASRRRPSDVLGGHNLDQKNKEESDELDWLEKSGQLCGLFADGGFRPYSFKGSCELNFPLVH